jgi:hypothetical protein
MITLNLTHTPSEARQDVLSAYTQLAMRATMSDIADAAVWYDDARDVALEVARNLGSSLEIGASIVAAFSPRQTWGRNVINAIAFSNGEHVPGLANNMTMAQNALLFGFDALNGQKTNAFARNIAGDTNAVTIDVWMIRAAGFDAAKGVNKSEYNLLADCVRDVAAAFGLSPAVMQALIWIVARGDAK